MAGSPNALGSSPLPPKLFPSCMTLGKFLALTYMPASRVDGTLAKFSKGPLGVLSMQQVLLNVKPSPLSTYLLLGVQILGAPNTLSPPFPLPQDWNTVGRQEEAPSWDELTVMIPRKPQEGPRADRARKAPSLLTWSPVGGDAAGQKKEGESWLGQLGHCDHRCGDGLGPGQISLAIWVLRHFLLW